MPTKVGIHDYWCGTQERRGWRAFARHDGMGVVRATPDGYCWASPYYAGSLGPDNEFLPNGWAVADGSIMTFAANSALGSVIGDQFGGNGSTTYALPNLLGRAAVGATATNPIGTQFGQAATSLTTGQLPPGGTPVNNDQPSLSVSYIIATQGIFPSQGGTSGGFSQTTATLGEIVAFAGNYAPAGWAFANGQTLLDTSNDALFNLIGTTYGSGGPGTFDLPDLDGRTIIGADGTSILAGFEEGDDFEYPHGGESSDVVSRAGAGERCDARCWAGWYSGCPPTPAIAGGELTVPW